VVVRKRFSTNVYLTPEFFLLFVPIDFELSLFREIRDFYCSFGVEWAQRFRDNVVCVKSLVKGVILVLRTKARKH